MRPILAFVAFMLLGLATGWCGDAKLSPADKIVQEISKMSVVEQLDIIEKAKRQLVNQLTTVPSDIEEQYADFAAGDRCGLAQLANRGLMDDGCYYSFTARNHDYNDEPQLEFCCGNGQAYFSTAFVVGTYGCVVKSKDNDIERLTLDGAPSFCKGDEVLQINSRATGWESLGSVADSVYFVRSGYPGEFDTLAAFKVLRVDSYSITIAWKILQDYPIPPRQR